MFDLVMQRPTHLSSKEGLIYITLSIFLLLLVALFDIIIKHYVYAHYDYHVLSSYLDVMAYLVAAFIGIAYAGDKFDLSGSCIPFVLAAIPLSITMFYTRVWLVDTVIVTVSGGWPNVLYLVDHLILVCVVIPVFEEVVTRTLFFIGMARYIGYVPSAIITSILFAAAHPQWICAFIVSCVLCYMTYRGVSRSSRRTNLVARVLFHSIYNIIVIGLTIYNGVCV